MRSIDTPERFDHFVDAYGQRVRTHGRAYCADNEACCVHSPSSHHMAAWPRVWQDGTAQMFRLCPKHGREHPDPDDLAFRFKHEGLLVTLVLAMHDCCGCCGSVIDGEVVVMELPPATPGGDSEVLPVAPAPEASPGGRARELLPASLQEKRHIEACEAEADTCVCDLPPAHEPQPHRCRCGGEWRGVWGSWAFEAVHMPRPHDRLAH